MAHQICNFIELHQAHIVEVPPPTRSTAQLIVELYKRPELAKQSGTRASSESRASSGTPEGIYPPAWVKDLPTFRKVVKAFDNRTTSFRSDPQIQARLLPHFGPDPIDPTTRTPAATMAGNPVTLSDAQFQQLLGAITQQPAQAKARDRDNNPRDNDKHSNRFKPKDLGYFDPNDALTAVETSYDKLNYHNVFSFT